MTPQTQLDPDLAQAVIDRATQVRDEFFKLRGDDLPPEGTLIFEDPRFVNANNSMVSLVTCQGREEIACMLFEHGATDDGVSVEAARAWLTIDGKSIEFFVDMIGNEVQVTPMKE